MPLQGGFGSYGGARSFAPTHAGIARPGFDRSMQPAPPGSILDGLQRPSGLNVLRRATMAARSSGEKSLGMNSIFSTPMPCSPVTLPPTAMHSSRISWLARRRA